ncbi:MAG: hypothetical protein LH467_15015, partial [Gemmatimonadaceae bacterium]|nr:hypothetical protein [Gemmatimonadaceae bacterium]
MASRSADARGQWAVTIAPTMDPLPLGFCGAVRLQLLDETGKDRPRNPAGQLIGMADFDMSVTSSDTRAVVGQYIDASHWSVCACHAGVAGAIATITASYPARHLAPASRVPGVAFQKQATLTLTRGAGQANPRGCDAPQPAAIVAAGVTAGGTSVTASAAPLTVVGADVASGVVAVAPGRVSGAVPASGNDATSVGGGASIGQGLITGPPSSIAPTSKSKPTPAPTPPVPVGPEPKDVQILGTPAEAVISWYAPYTYGSPAPTGYTVERWKQSDPACCRATSPVLTAREWRDPVMWSGVWMYKVMAMYADGRRGSAQRSYTYAGPTIPTGFKAVQVGRDSVVLTWNKVSGASYYLVGGPPTNVMFRADSPRAVITGVPVGSHTWKLASMYEAKTGDASPPKQSSAFEHASVAVVQRQYRIIAEALRVTQATVDDPWSGDGRWDEVFVTSLAELFDHKTGNLLTRLPPVVSVVHGDVAKYPSPEGVRAGSASADGGIRHGDVVTPIVGPPAARAGGGPPPGRGGGGGGGGPPPQEGHPR